MAECSVYIMEQCNTIIMKFMEMIFGFEGGLTGGSTQYLIGGGF